MALRIVSEGAGEVLADKIKLNQSSITTVQTAVQNIEDSALPVDAVCDYTSENPVQNKAVSLAIKNIEDNALPVDAVLDATSTNPIQNMVVKAAIDDLIRRVTALEQS